MALVDTTIWSLAIRRRPDRLSPREQALVDPWVNLVTEGTALLIGPIRQEILSGIRNDEAFEAIRRRLAAFLHLPIVDPGL
jgi:predicted nucleic acid-binding protein